MQAGGHRFDPGHVHQFPKQIDYFSEKLAPMPELGVTLVSRFHAGVGARGSAIARPDLEGARVTAKAKDKRWDTEFSRFVESYGVTLLAARLDVRKSAIYHWLSGSTSPHPSNAIKIQKLAKRRRIELTLDQIYQHFREVFGERYTPASLRLKFGARNTEVRVENPLSLRSDRHRVTLSGAADSERGARLRQVQIIPIVTSDSRSCSSLRSVQSTPAVAFDSTSCS